MLILELKKQDDQLISPFFLSMKKFNIFTICFYKFGRIIIYYFFIYDSGESNGRRT